MEDKFASHYEEEKKYLSSGLPYWCDDFNRPADKEFANYLNNNGFHVQYLILELFEQVYIPTTCDLNRVKETAKVRVFLKREEKDDTELPIFL